jgi:G:T-mismatch repair DNA endonuclease (very short patch repair protein)
MRDFTCQHCQKVFIPGAGCIGKFCSKSCNATFYNAIRRTNKPSKIQTGKCKQCNLPLFNKNNKFCSRSCAAKYNNPLKPTRSEESRNKTSKSNKSSSNRPHQCKISFCKVCGTLIRNSHRSSCSDKCKTNLLQAGGRNSAATRIKRSKDEIKLYNLCKIQFLSVRHNESLTEGWDADIIIDDYKIAILWNGVWHYRQMPHNNHSLSQVQNRDKIKIQKLTEIGWKVLVYEDQYFTPKTAFEDILLRILDSNQDKR